MKTFLLTFSIFFFFTISISAQKPIHNKKNKEVKKGEVLNGPKASIKEEILFEDAFLKTYADENPKKEIYRTHQCQHCNAVEFFEKTGDSYVKVTVDKSSKRVTKNPQCSIKIDGNTCTRNGSYCCPAKMKESLKGVTHENIWESKM